VEPPMSLPNKIFSRLLQDAAADFRLAENQDDLWMRLHRHLAGFGITAAIYGMEAMENPDRDHFFVINSINKDWFEAKVKNNLFLCDGYVRSARSNPSSILWSDVEHILAMPPESRRSLEIDFDFGVTAGVTMPMRFANGLGVSSIGCHAEGMRMADFDRIWAQDGQSILSIVNAFDVCLREDHIADLCPLTASERECLLWLASGLTQKQVADRLRLSDKRVEKCLTAARGKLNAATTTQAVASALIFGLIDP